MELIEQLEEICSRYDCQLLKEEPLSRHTTFRIGGKCRALVDVNCTDVLIELVKFCSENSVRWTVLGNGSNVLVSDEGYDGVVFVLGKQFSRIDLSDNYTVSCQSGAYLMNVAKAALE